VDIYWKVDTRMSEGTGNYLVRRRRRSAQPFASEVTNWVGVLSVSNCGQPSRTQNVTIAVSNGLWKG